MFRRPSAPPDDHMSCVSLMHHEEVVSVYKAWIARLEDEVKELSAQLRSLPASFPVSSSTPYSWSATAAARLDALTDDDGENSEANSEAEAALELPSIEQMVMNGL